MLPSALCRLRIRLLPRVMIGSAPVIKQGTNDDVALIRGLHAVGINGEVHGCITQVVAFIFDTEGFIIQVRIYTEYASLGHRGEELVRGKC
jgi:hypothetical protein